MSFHGGSYRSCRNFVVGNRNFDCHHLIARGALKAWYQAMKHNRYTRFLSYESQNWAPAIVMTHKDHMRTRSYYHSDHREAAQKYIDNQAQQLIQKGDIVAVLKTEENIINELFETKYKTALEEMWSYFYSLHPTRTETVLSFTNPNISNFTFYYDFSFK